jgi:hypothetical protein
VLKKTVHDFSLKTTFQEQQQARKIHQSKLLKAGGKPVLRELQKLFNAVLFERRTPDAWSRSMVVLFFKKRG